MDLGLNDGGGRASVLCKRLVFSRLDRGVSIKGCGDAVVWHPTADVVEVGGTSGSSALCESNSHEPESEVESSSMSSGSGIDGVVRLRSLFTTVMGFIEPRK